MEGPFLSRERANSAKKCSLHWILNATNLKTITLRIWRFSSHMQGSYIETGDDIFGEICPPTFVLDRKNDFIPWIIHKRLAEFSLLLFKRFSFSQLLKPSWVYKCREFNICWRTTCIFKKTRINPKRELSLRKLIEILMFISMNFRIIWIAFRKRRIVNL